MHHTMPYDLFISYSRRDNGHGRITEFVERICRDFESLVSRPLIPFFDITEIQGMDDWRHRILQGLRESRLLLAFVSPNYLESEYCEWEFNEYVKNEVARAPVGEGVAPIYFVEVPGWQDKDFDHHCADWITELRRRQRFDLRTWFHEGFREGEQALSDAEALTCIAQLNLQIRERIRRGERAEQGLGNVYAYNPHFTGRKTERRHLRETVALKKIGVLTAVHGLGGIGKTALAIEYAHAFAHEYGGGRWQVRCEGRDNLAAAIAALASALHIEFTDAEKIDVELQFERVLAELHRLADSREPHRCLLIFDNVDRPALLEPAQTQRLPSADWLHVIATTRLGENDLFSRHKDRAFLAVDEMPDPDALDLIESYQLEGAFATDAEREAAREIVRLLGGFTLAIEIAAVFLGQYAGDVTCSGFLLRLKKEGLEALEGAAAETSEGVRHGEKRLTATLRPTLERLNEREKLALTYAALLPADQIPLPWLRALLVAHYPDLGEDAEPGHPDAWQSVLRQLLSLRLLQVTSILDSNGQPLVARMHRLLQELMRNSHEGRANSQAVSYLERMKSRWRARSVTRRARALTAALVQHAKSRAKFLRDAWKYPENQWELKPLAACARQWMERGHKDATSLANEVSVHLNHLAYFTESEDLLRRALAIDEKNFGACHHIVALRLISLAHVLQDTNRLIEAEPLMRQTLAIYEQLFGSDDDRVSLALNNLAQLLQDTNRLTEAEPLMRRALAIDEHNFGPNDSRVAGRLNNLAMLLKETNRFVDAEALMRRALAISEQSGPSNNPSIAIECGNLAQLLLRMNRLTEAEPLMKRALAINEQNFGPDHATVAMSLNNLAGLLKAQNRLTEAEELLERALIIEERTFGPDHPSVAIHLGNLASVLQATNRLTQAEQLQRRALAIDEQSFGPDHPNVALCLNNLATLLCETNRLTEAEPLMKRALAIDQQSYGLAHPNVARDLSNLAQLLSETERIAEAEPLMKRALAIDEQSFGPDHPNVARNLNNLAQLLQDTNRLTEAEPLMKRALAIDEQSFGPDHPDVAIGLNNLAQLLQDTNRLTEAEALMKRALAIDEQSFGPDHPKVAIRLNNLARLLQDTNRLTDAEPLMKRALAIDQQSFGPDHPKIALRLNSLAKLFQATNRLSEAEPMMFRALKILLASSAANGREHAHLSAIVGTYEAVLRQMGYDEAQVIAELDKVGSPFGIQLGSRT